MRNVLFFLCVFNGAISVLAQNNFSLFYLSIGSGHYEQRPSKFTEQGFIPYDQLPEAIASAKCMEKILIKYGKAGGRTVLSSDKNRISKKRIFQALDSLELEMKKSKKPKPMLVFYYCGHGISENLAWNQFLVPGDYTAIAGSKDIESLAEETIYLGDIIDRLDQGKYRYLVMIDCCRKEESDNSLPEKDLRYFFSDQNLETLKTTAAIIRVVNEFRQINPVVFSIEPGFLTPVVDVPDNAITNQITVDKEYQIGPICRRLLILLNKSQGKAISLENLVSQICHVDLDRESPTSISHYAKDEDPRRNYILFSN